MSLEDHGFSSEEQMAATIKPLTEHAGIMRRQLIKQGWSRAGAEQFTRDIVVAGLTNSATESAIRNFTNRNK